MPVDGFVDPPKLEIVPRSPRFEVGNRAHPFWHGGDVAKTALWDAFSIFLPSGERFFVRSVRHFKPQVQDPLLKREVDAFLAQEANHSREHQIYNAGLEKLGHDVERLEAPVTAVLQWVARRWSPRIQLAVTCTLEHFTALISDAMLRDPVFFAGADQNYTDLWLWHFIEEIEHKAVAFDVLQLALSKKSRLSRYQLTAIVFVCVSVLFNLLWIRNVGRLIAGHPWHRRLEYWLRISWYLWGLPGLYRRSLRNYCRYLLPNFHPWQHDNRQLLEECRHTLFSRAAFLPERT